MVVEVNGGTGVSLIQDGTVSSAAKLGSGVVTLKTQVGMPPSMVRLNTSNGYGSTNTLIRRFTNIVTNTGSDITYADSATLGASFTINTDGVYAIQHSDQGAGYCGLSLNTTQPSTSVASLPVGEVLSVGVLNSFGNAMWTGWLPAGSVVRPHHVAVNAGGTSPVQFTIVRVA